MISLSPLELTLYLIACGLLSLVCAPIGVGLFAAFLSWVEERKARNSSSRCSAPRAGLKAPHSDGGRV